MKRIVLLGLVVISAGTGCAETIIGSWVTTNAPTTDGTADVRFRFEPDMSFAFEATARRALDAPMFPGCAITTAMTGFRWSDSHDVRRFTVTATPEARMTFTVTDCTDPRSNVAEMVSTRASDPPVTIDYALTEMGLYMTGEIAGWRFRAGMLTVRRQP